MSKFLAKTQKMIEQLDDREIELVLYRKDFISFGHETVVYLNWKRKFFVEFFHDGRDDVDYSISVAGYYGRYNSDLEEYKNLNFISLNDLSKRLGWVGKEEFLTFEQEFKALYDKYDEDFRKLLRRIKIANADIRTEA